MADTSSIVVFGPDCYKKKVTVGLVITVKACVSVEYTDGKYEIVLNLGDLGTHRLPLPEDQKTIAKYPVIPGVTFTLAAERRDKADPSAGYRLVAKLDVPIFPDVQVFAIVVKFAKIPAVPAAGGDASPTLASMDPSDPGPSHFVAVAEDERFDASIFAEA